MGGGELQPYNVVSTVVYEGRPLDALTALGTDGLFALPIDLEVLHAETLLGARLPTIVRSSGAKEIDPVVFLALGQELGVQVAGVHELGLGEQTLLL